MDVLCRGSGKGGCAMPGGNCKGASAWMYYAGAVVRNGCCEHKSYPQFGLHGGNRFISYSLRK